MALRVCLKQKTAMLLGFVDSVVDGVEVRLLQIAERSQSRVDFQGSQDHALIAMQHSQILAICRWGHVGRS